MDLYTFRDTNYEGKYNKGYLFSCRVSFAPFFHYLLPISPLLPPEKKKKTPSITLSLYLSPNFLLSTPFTTHTPYFNLNDSDTINIILPTTPHISLSRAYTPCSLSYHPSSLLRAAYHNTTLVLSLVFLLSSLLSCLPLHTYHS